MQKLTTQIPILVFGFFLFFGFNCAYGQDEDDFDTTQFHFDRAIDTLHWQLSDLEIHFNERHRFDRENKRKDRHVRVRLRNDTVVVTYSDRMTFNTKFNPRKYTPMKYNNTPLDTVKYFFTIDSNWTQVRINEQRKINQQIYERESKRYIAYLDSIGKQDSVRWVFSRSRTIYSFEQHWKESLENWKYADKELMAHVHRLPDFTFGMNGVFIDNDFHGDCWVIEQREVHNDLEYMIRLAMELNEYHYMPFNDAADY